jgi:hypothetical protein
MDVLQRSPASRAATAALLVGGTLYFVKPITFFTADGRPRMARVAVSRQDQIEESVVIPWWGVALAVGAVMDLFV